MSPRSAFRRTVGPAVRAGSALLLTFAGTLLAVGSYLGMQWHRHPWPGDDRSTLGAVGFGLLTVVLIAAPMAAWWFLVPRARWWGIPVGVLVTVGTFAALVPDI